MLHFTKSHFYLMLFAAMMVFICFCFFHVSVVVLLILLPLRWHKDSFLSTGFYLTAEAVNIGP